MEALTKQALTNARTKISETFSDPSSLDDLGVLSLQLEKQLAAAETQLNGAVQSKLDSLKRAVDLMDESSAKLHTLSFNINRIDEKIAQTNTAISKYEYLKRVHNTRENLSKVIAQVEFFAKVPERVTYLRELLENTPAKLKEVYLESLKYESLRVALMKEIKVNKRKMSVAGGMPTKGQGSDYSEDAFSKVKSAVENHLRIVPELMKDVMQRVFDNIERMWDLAVNSPQDLVTAYEIIEMQQEYNDRRNLANGDANNNEPAFEDIVQLVTDKIKGLFEEKVEGEFEAMAQFNNEKITRMGALIMAANQILQKLIIFKEDILPCMPPHYEAMLLFVNAFEEQLMPRINDIMSDLSNLKVAEILDLINWIEYHKACMEEFNFNDRESITTFANMKIELLVEYKVKIKTQVAEWFDNIQNQPLEIRQNDGGILITSHPEDMFNILHAQLDVARDKLPIEYTKEVAIACLQVLQGVQRTSYDHLSNNWRTMEPDVMCAIINDNQRMQEKCDELGEYLMKYVEEGQDKDTLKFILEEVSGEYITLAVKAVSLLAKCILFVLDEHFFSKLYSTEWESGENFNGILTATLTDYFSDLEKWLGEYFYSKLVKETLITVINNYVMQIRKKANGVFLFGSEIVVANRIISDKTAIETFFENYTEVLKRGGLNKPSKVHTAATMPTNYSVVTEELAPLISLARVISARHITGVESDAKSLFVRWGVDGLKVVQAAFYSNPSLGKNERTQNIEASKRLFDQGPGNNQPPYSTKLLEEFVGFDSALPHNSHANSNKDGGATVSSGFFGWGRKK